MAYKSELPASTRVHPIFHVSCLKKVIGDKLPAQTILPKLDNEGKIILEPEAVMETRTQQLRNRSISKYLIKWKNLPIEDSSWKDENIYTEASITTQALRKTIILKERGMLGPYNTSIAPYCY